jgi:hypothetical protein
MGFIGQEFGGEVGGLLGSYVGNKFKNKKAGQKIGSLVGKVAGSYLPFEKGGYVKPIKGKTQIALLHKGELVIPRNMTKHISKTLKTKLKRNGARNM